MRIRGGAGLGDSIYLRVIAMHLLSRGEEVTVCSDYPDVFDGAGVRVLPFTRERIDRLCHYTVGKTNPKTKQFDDMLAAGGITGPVPLRMAWETRDTPLVSRLRGEAAGRPIILVHGGCAPMNRTDSFGRELMPEERGFQIALNSLAEEQNAFLVRIGKGPDLYTLVRTHCDLHDQTSVLDLFDLASMCDGVVAQVSYAVPLAEVFDKPLLAIWARAGTAPGVHMYIRQILPEKILYKPTSHFCWDDWPAEQIQQAARDFRS